MFYRKPRNVRTRNLRTVKCRFHQRFFFFKKKNRSGVSKANSSSRAGGVSKANSSSRDVVELPIFLIPFQCTLEERNPFLVSQYQFFFAGAGCHTSRMPSSFIDGSKSSCSLPSRSKLAKPKEFFPRPESWLGEVPLGWRNRVSTDSQSIPQLTRRLPNIILPPPLDPPCCCTFEPPRMSPYDVSCKEKERLEFEKFPTPSTFNDWQLNSFEK